MRTVVKTFRLFDNYFTVTITMDNEIKLFQIILTFAK
jgi:hypothetical protein